MAINSFSVNAEYAERHVKHIILFYRRRYGQCVYFTGSHCSTAIQKQFHADAVIGVEDQSIVTEIKTAKQHGTPLTRMYLEYQSCSIPGYRTPGWIVTSKADTLTYAYMLQDGSSDTYIVSMNRLQAYFKAKVGEGRWEPHKNQDQNQSAGYLVPLREIKEHLTVERYRIQPDGTFKQLWEAVKGIAS